MPSERSESIKANSKEALQALQQEVETLIHPLGYEVVALELSTAGGRSLRLSIDYLENETLSDQLELKRIGLDDCVVVNRAVDELLENTPLLTGAYNLEVSSPGVERPLRKASDYKRFAGQKARIHTFRPLTAEELKNAPYWEKNKRQKNFLGVLQGLSEDGAMICLFIDKQPVTIPLDLVSKSHLEYVEPTPTSRARDTSGYAS